MSNAKISLSEVESQARALRVYLNRMGLDISSRQTLEAVAQQHGFHDWNSMASQIPDAKQLFIVDVYSEESKEEEDSLDATVFVETTTPDLAVYHTKALINKNFEQFSGLKTLRFDRVHRISSIPTEGMIYQVERHQGEFTRTSVTCPNAHEEDYACYDCGFQTMDITPFKDEGSETTVDSRTAWMSRIVSIRAAIEQNGGNKSAAARELGISLRTLYRALKKAEDNAY